MRSLVAAIALSLVATPAAAGEGDKQTESPPKASKKATEAAKRRAEAAERRRRERAKRILDAAALEKGIAPHVADIFDCYRTHAIPQKTATGGFRIEVIILPKGTVKKLWIDAPGVRGKAKRQLEQCIRAGHKQWEFAERPGFTHAAIPFYVQRTTARGAGPKLGNCWNRQSCARARRLEQKRAAAANKSPPKNNTSNKKSKPKP